MKSDIIIIGGGASGLMAAYSAAKTLVEAGSSRSVVVLEKMPRPARKLMITGKGRCNFTNCKPWNEFSQHIRSNPSLVKAAFYNFPPKELISFFEKNGVRSVVERGDRVFPESGRASDVVDALVRACCGLGVKIESGAEVSSLEALSGSRSGGTSFSLTLKNGTQYSCKALVLATGGLSYPSTGSTGDGLAWASSLGHKISPTFPSLTALVPAGYKQGFPERGKGGGRHIARETPLAAIGEALCGVSLRNVGVSLVAAGSFADSAMGDIDFTDGGIEGPIGFLFSRKAVKAMINGSSAELVLDLKPAVEEKELTLRIESLWEEISKDERSHGLKERQRLKVLYGKLLPRELVPVFLEGSRGFSAEAVAKALKEWHFPLAGFVGYERAVVTAGGVSAEGVVPKSLSSRLCSGLYFCGEVLDVDADTGGYNLQLAFSTGVLSGSKAAEFVLQNVDNK